MFIGEERFCLFKAHSRRYNKDTGICKQHKFEIIGEATKNLSDDFRVVYSDIPWKDMAGMRDKLIHQYFGVDIFAVWDSIEQNLPLIKEQITSILQFIKD